MSLKILRKHATLRLHEYNWLKQKEVDCRCNREDCTQTLLDEKTFDSFIATRKEYDQPIKVNSWFRCQQHNRQVGGLDASRHKLGFACDLQPQSREYTLVELHSLAEVARKHFKYVKMYPGKVFLHCHNEHDTDWDWYTGSKTEKEDAAATLEYNACGIGGFSL